MSDESYNSDGGHPSWGNLDIKSADMKDAFDDGYQRGHAEGVACVENITPEGAAIIQTAKAMDVAAERERILDEIKTYADTCIWIDDDCCPGRMNDKEESDCDGCSYVDYPNNADICEKIESLYSHK